jgi:hypothetical protein
MGWRSLSSMAVVATVSAVSGSSSSVEPIGTKLRYEVVITLFDLLPKKGGIIRLIYLQYRCCYRYASLLRARRFVEILPRAISNGSHLPAST